MQKLPEALYRAAQVKMLDRLAIEDYGIPGYELMCRAGSAVMQCVQAKWPAVRTLAVLCGGGNNAGDGYVVARLAQSAGYGVTVYAVAEPENLKGDALTAYCDTVQSGINVVPFQPGQAIKADVLVDALLGTGLDRPVTGAYADAVAAINAARLPVLAIDIPSGLHADTGCVLSCAVKAAATVTFIGLKQGLFTGDAADYCGELFYDSLVVPEQLFERVKTPVSLVSAQPLPPRARCAHKGDMGHVLVVGGEVGFSGAVRMAGEAALRVGAGLVTIATRPAHAELMNQTRPELMCRGIKTIEQLSALLDKADVVVLGPGLGVSHWADALFQTVLDNDKPCVIDADGLNLLAKLPVSKSNWILTPHPGEAARLLHCSIDTVQQDRFAAVEAIRAIYSGIIVLKGAGTLIAGQARLAVSTTGNPGMASGGMGDILAGVIGGLLAQGLSLQDAAEQGVYAHGYAADEAVLQDGERGLLATDLLPHLRRWVNACSAS